MCIILLLMRCSYLYIFVFKMLINFSSFNAFCMLPSIFNLPVISAFTGFNFPINISYNPIKYFFEIILKYGKNNDYKQQLFVKVKMTAMLSNTILQTPT